MHSFAVGIVFLLALAGRGYTQSTPYQGPGTEFPGLLKVENFDVGGPGVAYFIMGELDRQGNYREFRPDETVSLDQQAGRVQVGWFHGGSWIKYTYDAKVSGSYDLHLTYRCGSWDEPRRVSFDFGRERMERVDFTFNFNDMGWSSNLEGERTLVAGGLSLEAGPGVLTIENTGNSDINLVALELELVSVSTRNREAAGGAARSSIWRRGSRVEFSPGSPERRTFSTDGIGRRIPSARHQGETRH